MIIRVIEATPNIPVGLIVETPGIAVGGKVEKEVNGVEYSFTIDGIQPLSKTVFKIWNSNVVVLVEVIEA